MENQQCGVCDRDPGRGSSCQHCGARIYKYAIDEPFVSSVESSNFEDDGEFDLDLLTSSDPSVATPKKNPVPRPSPKLKPVIAPRPTQPPVSLPRSTPTKPARKSLPRGSWRFILFIGFIVIRAIVDFFGN